MPAWMHKAFSGVEERSQTKQLIAATVAMEQCQILYENGIRDFHFYTLNRAELSYAICHMFGKRKKIHNKLDPI